MFEEILVGLGVLGAAAAAAWLLARRGRKGARSRMALCPHCGAQTPPPSKSCPSCSREIRLCPTCRAPILEGEGSCEVCGEILTRRAPPLCTCPSCGSEIDGRSTKCPSCGEEFWSPIVAHR